MLGCGSPDQGSNCYEPPTAPFAPHAATEPLVWVAPPINFGRDGEGVSTVTWLPWDYNTRAFYPVELDGDVAFRVRVMVGESTILRDGDWARMVVYVDGRPVMVRTDDSSAALHDLPFHDGIVAREVVIAANQLGPGLNQVNVVFTLRLDGRWGTQLAPTFTVANGSIEPQAYEETPLDEVTTPARELSTFTDPATGAERSLQSQPAQNYISRLRGSLQLNQYVMSVVPDGRCVEGFDRGALVALRDGVPAQIGVHDRILYVARRGQPQRQLRHTISLWEDADTHTYAVLVFAGLGRSVRRDGGGISNAWAAGPTTLVLWNGAL